MEGFQQPRPPWVQHRPQWRKSRRGSVVLWAARNQFEVLTLFYCGFWARSRPRTPAARDQPLNGLVDRKRIGETLHHQNLDRSLYQSKNELTTTRGTPRPGRQCKTHQVLLGPNQQYCEAVASRHHGLVAYL